MTKEQLADKIIEEIKNNKFDNNKISVKIEIKEPNERYLSNSNSDNPFKFDSYFLNRFCNQIVEKLAKIENNSEYLITMSFSIFGGKKPNNLYLICGYNYMNGFIMFYHIKSDYSYLVNE